LLEGGKGNVGTVDSREFADKAAIVVGGGSGIGAATVLRLTELGASVAIFDINAAAAVAVADQVSPKELCTAHEVDVSDDGALGAAVSTVVQRSAKIDFLVITAASFISAGLEASSAEWDRSLGVNIKGCAASVSSISRHMPPGSAIVNVGSISAHIAQPNRWTYNATKAAIVEMTKCQALDLAPRGVRVNVVSPGWIWTPEVSKAAGGDRARWEPVWGRYHILGRLGEPEEVARAIVFLLSSAASFITATELMVDGGYSALSAEGAGDDSKFASTR
jgi:NAD(P)-dependent dehydrogenase (short-subunit alcohol dehydrogenase family)